LLCYARLELESGDAENIVKALRVDDPSFCKCYAEDNKIIIEVVTSKISSLLYAVDDYLMHIKMCEQI
jgi:tRNA threonylcarbamoyladenosine modification (KEOPS) complex  Pcc1 subunit